MNISPDGYNIVVATKIANESFVQNYNASALPSKYHQYYAFCTNFVDTIKTKTPKITLNHKE